MSPTSGKRSSKQTPKRSSGGLRKNIATIQQEQRTPTPTRGNTTPFLRSYQSFPEMPQPLEQSFLDIRTTPDNMFSKLQDSPTSFIRHNRYSGRLAEDRTDSPVQFDMSIMDSCTPTPNRSTDGTSYLDSGSSIDQQYWERRMRRQSQQLHRIRSDESPSPSPSPSLLQSQKLAHKRRLRFSSGDIAQAAAELGASLDNASRRTSLSSGPTSAPPMSATPVSRAAEAALFTPPTTKLVRPDPSAFMSTGLQSKKQHARRRSSNMSSFYQPPETPCRKASDIYRTPTLRRSTEDMMRLARNKHSMADSSSIKRTRKKAHLAPPETAEGSVLYDPLESPTRGRQNTLVEEQQLHSFRPLPPSFASQHQQVLFGMGMDGKRYSWEECSESSAATLAGLGAAARTDSMELDEYRDNSSDDEAAEDPDDVFGTVTGRRAGGPVIRSTSFRSARIDTLERPQMPQIIRGCATNYPHFLRREYFWQSGRTLPFLAPTSEFLVDGLGYLDYFSHNFDMQSDAGEGEFSTVHTVRGLADGRMYAVKKTRHPFSGRQQRARKLKEAELLWSVPMAPGVVHLVDAWEQYGHLYLQFELCERGSLADYIDVRSQTQDERLPELRIWAILAHGAASVARLHASGIVHMDVKPANFLLGPRFEEQGAERRPGWLKLADFGHAIRIPLQPGESIDEGDREYMAAETLRGIGSPAADVFSLGMMVLEIAADIVLPDNGVEWHKLREACFDDPIFAELPYSAALLDTIKKMLHPDPLRRPELRDILAMSQCSPYLSAIGMPYGCHHTAPLQRPPLHSALVRASTAINTAPQPQQQNPPASPSVHPMLTRSAAATMAAHNGGLARRTASAPGSAPPQSTSSAASTPPKACATAH